jgi:hypothetical protein
MEYGTLKEIEKLCEKASEVREFEMNGKKYATGLFTEIKEKDDFKTIEQITFNDLKSFAEIINNEKSQLIPNSTYWVKINSEKQVELISDLVEKEKRRSNPYEANALVPAQQFEKWLDYERFVIWLRSSFVATPDVNDLIQLIAGYTQVENKEMYDDGITQTVKTQKGTQVKSGEVKSIVKLQPYRTFAECEQPESDFLFRIQGNGTQFGLFEADGGRWKLQAKQNIKTYLETVIKKDNGVSILL